MSESLYERYKDALRRGHVAALRGRHDVAIDAYREASQLAPDRALPFVGIAGVLERLGRTSDALAAYDAAIERGPGDEAALRGRAELLVASGDRIAAAAAFDRLAAVLDAGDRLTEATDVARRALELAESRGRRVAVRGLAERLRAAGAEDPAANQALAEAMRVLAGPALTERDEGTSDDPAAPGPDGSLVGPSETPEVPPAPPFDGGDATASVEDAAMMGDPTETLARALAAAAGHRAAGANAAAIDVCYIALAGAPDDPALHLALADLYLDRGWRTIAADKLVLLARLAELADDGLTRERVCEIALARLPEEARLAATCPRP